MNPLQFVKNLYDPAYMQGLIHSGGVPLIAAIVFAETGLLVGFFLPGDTMLFLSGVAAGSLGPNGQPWLDIGVLVPALIAAAIVGDQSGYWLGKQTGHAIFTRAEGRFFKRENAVKAHELCVKYGVWAVVFAKFAPVFRTFVPFMAGVGEMPYRRYLLVDSVAVVGWICLIVLTGYGLGTNPYTQKYLGYIIVGIAAVSMLPMAIGILREVIVSLGRKGPS
ncbi:MAG: VTT domain-containing protein [Verrucomicrobiota bacterium]